MNKKIFLTSAIMMCMIAPAIAEPSNTGTFPANGLMQADYTYTNAATSTNMAGVYEGTVNANAQYTDILYTVTAGNYLPADGEAVVQCTAGNFCPGLQSQVTYSATNNQGLETCPSGYTNSAAGASANTQCYRTCTTADVSHSTAVTGAMYYNGTSGDGVNACEPTSNGCANGYHYVAAVTAPDLNTLIGTVAGAFNNYDNGGFYNVGSFTVPYSDNRGTITGSSRCASQSGELNSTSVSFPEGNGGFLWCKLDSYTPANGVQQSLSGPWVLANIGYDDTCGYEDAFVCAWMFGDITEAGNLAFRAAAFGSVQSSPAMCDANTITINWGDTDAADITANNAGTATYGSDIRTPVKAQTKKGKTFTGWIFSKPANNNNGNN